MVQKRTLGKTEMWYTLVGIFDVVKLYGIYMVNGIPNIVSLAKTLLNGG